MQIRALRTIRGDSGNIRRGDEAEVSDSVGRSLVARGLAEELGEKTKKRSRSRSNGESKTTRSRRAPAKAPAPAPQGGDNA